MPNRNVKIRMITEIDATKCNTLGLTKLQKNIFVIKESFYRTFFQGLEFQANILRPFSDSCFRENTIYMSQER